MAKYSRSALSMKESLPRDKFGRKPRNSLILSIFNMAIASIADLAHIALAIERLSILAALNWRMNNAGMARNAPRATRISRKSGYYTPDFGTDNEVRKLYRETLDFLFAEYEALSAHMTQHLISITPKPGDMKQEQYERTLKARAFDITRYLLPLATNTSLC